MCECKAAPQRSTNHMQSGRNSGESYFKMVNKYKRKTSNASWDEHIMKLAMEEAKKGSVRKAAKTYGINLSTLQRHIKKGCPKKKLGRFTTAFTVTQEEELLEYVFHMDNLFFGLTKNEFLELVYQYAEINNIPHPFKNGSAGEDWYLGFKSRHPELSLRRPEPTSIARARGFNKPQVQRFFDLLEGEIRKHNIDATRIYNVDETGIQTSTNKPPRVLSRSGKKQVGVISSVERGKLTTVVCCCNAAGSFIPPFLIFGRKRMVPRLLDGAPPGSVARCTDNGWINGPTFLDWLRHFVDMTRPTPDKKILLVMDNHESHKYLEVLEFASKNNVIFVSLPPHTTHRLQPLDTCVYGPLKNYFEQAISLFQRTHVGRIISQYDVAKLFGTAYIKAASAHNAIKGFSSTGIWPTNRHIFDESDYMPAVLTDRQVINTEDVNNSASNEPNLSDIEQPIENPFSNIADVRIDHNADEGAFDSDRTISPSVLNENININSVCEPTPMKENEPPAAISTNISTNGNNHVNQLSFKPINPSKTPLAEVLPVNKSALSCKTVNAEVMSQNSPKAVVPDTEQEIHTEFDRPITPETTVFVSENQHKSPFDIRPIPQMAPNKTTRKRKTQKAEILTSTPIKEEQREKEKKKKPNRTKVEAVKKNLKGLKTGKKKCEEKKKKPMEPKASCSDINKRKVRSKHGPKNNQSDELKYACLICNELYTHPPIEDWIKCDDCNMWAHEACTTYSGRGSYFCDACQE